MNDPQAPDRLVQLTVHVTPAFEVSLVSVAIRFAVSGLPVRLSPRAIALGESEIVMGGGGPWMVNVALIDFVESAADVAVSVTAAGGTAPGAVYITSVVLVVPLSAVEGVPSDPHAPDAVEPHDVVHVAPAPVTSLAICTPKDVTALTLKTVGGVVAKEMAIGDASIFKVALLVADGSLVTAAVIVTVPPMGTVVGAVYTDAVPALVCAGDKVPQAPPLVLPVIGLPSQKTLQSTPAPCLSLTGVMLTSALALVVSDVRVAPAAFEMEMAPALTPEPLPQPATVAAAIRQIRSDENR